MVIWALCVIVAVSLSADGAKTFPDPIYVSSEDGVDWQWHLLVNLLWVFLICRTAEEGMKGEGISLIPHYHFQPLHRFIFTNLAEIVLESFLLDYPIYIYIYIYIYITYTVEKKENALIIHNVMEKWKHTIIRNFIILCLCHFSKISHPPWLRVSYATTASFSLLKSKVTGTNLSTSNLSSLLFKLFELLIYIRFKVF